MARTGFLPAENMRRTFDLMRGNDLIWNYVVNNWLMGEDPPAFDLLTWNADSTRMPADMHSFYLRSCYLENQLARGDMELAGAAPRPVDRRPGPVLPGRRAGPHRAVAQQLHGRPAAVRRRAVRAVQLRAHRRHRQPAQPEVPALRRRVQRPAGEPGRVAGRGHHASRSPGGRTGPTWIGKRAGRRAQAADAWATTSTRCSVTRPARTCSGPDVSRRTGACSMRTRGYRCTATVSSPSVTVSRHAGQRPHRRYRRMVGVSSVRPLQRLQGRRHRRCPGHRRRHRPPAVERGPDGHACSTSTPRGAQETARTICAETGNAASTVSAVTSATGRSCSAAFEQAAEAMDGIDTYIGNAGITRDRMFHRQTDDDWDAVIAVNLTGVYDGPQGLRAVAAHRGSRPRRADLLDRRQDRQPRPDELHRRQGRRRRSGAGRARWSWPGSAPRSTASAPASSRRR